MAKKVLIITDNTGGKFAGRFSNGEKLHILTLGFPGIELLNNSVFKRKDLGFTFEFINLKNIKNKAQDLTIQYCLDAKSRYSKLMNSNRELFSYDGINTWWFTAFSEMGSFKSNFVENIYFLSLIKLTIVESFDKIHLDIEDVDILLTTNKCLINLNKDFIFEKSKKVIYHKVKNKFFILFWLLHRLKFVSEQLIKLFFIKIFNIGFNPKSDNERVLLYSFYPSLWGKNETGTYEFRIFKDFKAKSEKSLKVNYLIYTEGIKSFLKTVLLDGNVFKKQEIILLEKYLNIFEVFSIFNFKTFKQIVNYIAFSKNNIKGNFFEFETSNIIINAINQSLMVGQLPRDILLFKSIKNLLHQVKIHGIVHASEFQCYEKAIWYACAGKCQTYAVQHSAIGKNWTNYYFNDGELKTFDQLGDSIYMPMPDYYLTAGIYPFKVMLNNGIEKNILKLVGAIRYDSLSFYLKHSNLNDLKMGLIKNNNQKTKILLLASVNRIESLNMILSTLSAIDNNCTLLFKSHPLNILDFEVEALFKKNKYYQELNIIPSEENYFDHIVNSNVVIFCNSTIGIESIALGIPSISFENYNSIKSYDIIEVKNSLYQATNSIEIQSAIQSIRTEDVALTKKKKTWEKTLSDTFYKLDGLSGNRMIDIINSNIN